MLKNYITVKPVYNGRARERNFLRCWQIPIVPGCP